MSDTTVKQAGVERIPAHAWYALGVLTLVYVLNFLDRVLIYFMFTPIKAELKFTDLQLGLLGATSFAIFYTLLGIPFGRMFFSAACALLSVPMWLALLFSDGAAMLLAANFFLLALSLMWLGAAAADVHDIAGPQLRGLGVAIYFFAVNLAAYGVGAPLVGHLNDRLGAASNPQLMRYSLLLCPLASALAALLLWRGSRKLESQTR